MTINRIKNERHTIERIEGTSSKGELSAGGRVFAVTQMRAVDSTASVSKKVDKPNNVLERIRISQLCDGEETRCIYSPQQVKIEPQRGAPAVVTSSC